MIEKVLPDFYKLKIPLPGNPLKSINSYVIKGSDRFLIIDTGMNREECMRPMLSGLEELEVDLKRTDFFITHFHSDHIGLVGNLVTDTSRIYFNEVEAKIIRGFGMENKEKPMGNLASIYLLYGFPEDELQRALDNHPGYKFRVSGQLEYTVLREGDIIGKIGICYV